MKLLATLIVALGIAAGSISCDDERRPPPASGVPRAPGPDAETRKSTQPAERAKPWPKLPTTREDAALLLTQRTVRGALDASRSEVLTQPAEASATRVLDLLRRRHGEGQVVAGFDAIAASLQARFDAAARKKHDVYLLFGTNHDAAAQLVALRRVVARLQGLSAVSVEHFQADGRWGGVSKSDQTGDSAALEQWLSAGSKSAYAELRKGRTERNYSAVKFGLVDELLDIAADARAQKWPLIACDMPSRLQKALGAIDGSQALRLRELHCLLTLDDQLEAHAGPRRVAMLWGDAHIGAEALPRFLPPDSEVIAVTMLGDRFANDLGVERDLAPRLAVFDPLLVPIDKEHSLLLLPGRGLGGSVEEKRDRRAPTREQLSAVSSVAGKLRSGGASVDVHDRPATLPVTAGPSTFLFETPSLLMAGALSLPHRGSVELEIDPKARSLVRTLVLPP